MPYKNSEDKKRADRERYRRRKARKQLALVGNSPIPLFDDASFEDQDESENLETTQCWLVQEDTKKELEAPAQKMNYTPNSLNSTNIVHHSTSENPVETLNSKDLSKELLEIESARRVGEELEEKTPSINRTPSINKVQFGGLNSHQIPTPSMISKPAEEISSSINSTNIQFSNLSSHEIRTPSMILDPKSSEENAVSWGIIGKVVFLLACLAVVSTTTSIIIMENAKILETQGHHWPLIFSIVLEVAIVLLVAYKHPIKFSGWAPANFFKFLKNTGVAFGMKIAAIALVAFSYKLATVSSEVKGQEKIANLENSSELSEIKTQIKIEQEALATFTKTRSIGAMGKTQKRISELQKKLDNAKSSESISSLKNVYENETQIASLGRGLPLLINLIFSHLLGSLFVTIRK